MSEHLKPFFRDLCISRRLFPSVHAIGSRTRFEAICVRQIDVAEVQIAVENAKGINVPGGKNRPSVLALSRQGMPNQEGSSIEGVSKGAYNIYGGQDKPDAIILATGWPSISNSDLLPFRASSGLGQQTTRQLQFSELQLAQCLESKAQQIVIKLWISIEAKNVIQLPTFSPYLSSHAT